MKQNQKTDIVLDCIRSGKKPITLVKTHNFSKGLLNYYLRTLKAKGIIRNLDKGVWEQVKEIPSVHDKRNIRGHAFIWKIKFLSELKNWSNRIEILNKLNIPFKLVGKDLNTPRIEIKGKKIWLTNKGLIIYENKSFYANLPLESRKLAIYELKETIKSIESKLKANFPKYEFSVKREHYALIKNDLAIQCNKEGNKIHLYDNGEWWGDVDNSHNLDEFEFFKTKSFSGLSNSHGANNYFNSQKNTNWKVTPDYVLNQFNNLIEDRKYWAEHQKSHVASIQTLGNQMKEFVSVVNELKEEIKKLNGKGM